MARSMLPPLLALLLLAGTARAQCYPFTIPFGSGCGNSVPFGIPVLQCNGAPTLGNAGFGLTATAPCPTSMGVLLIGQCPPSPIPIRGPFGDGGFCGPSMAVCSLSVNGPSVLFVPGRFTPGTGFWFALPVPSDPNLIGLTLCTQAASICTYPNNFSCLSASNGVWLVVR